MGLLTHLEQDHQHDPLRSRSAVALASTTSSRSPTFPLAPPSTARKHGQHGAEDRRDSERVVRQAWTRLPWAVKRAA